MSRKAARQREALARERARRQAGASARLEREIAADLAAAAAHIDTPPIQPAIEARPAPAGRSHPATQRTVGTGRRLPGQQVRCGWCGEPILIKSRGPLPKWCSATCRHRAWEQDRAARSGRSAIQVEDRYVLAVPTDVSQWIDQLGTLITQLGEPAPINPADLDHLAAVTELVQAAISARRAQRIY